MEYKIPRKYGFEPRYLHKKLNKWGYSCNRLERLIEIYREAKASLFIAIQEILIALAQPMEEVAILE